ncbi:MAG: TRAP transporter small permease [Hyphomicrobiaceae bacterium]|nr:TRAP transporter small permease [Hyphomicrobiaceae bacterium]
MAVEGGDEQGAPGTPRLLWAMTEKLALAGGIVILAAALLVCVSVSLRWTTSNSIPGDFELVQIAVALSAFAFLPYCQLRQGNIAVGTFTAFLPEAARSALDALWNLIYALTAAFIAWRLAIGASETIANGTTTMVSGLPIGWAIAAVAVMALLLAVTALATAVHPGRRSQ